MPKLGRTKKSHLTRQCLLEGVRTGRTDLISATSEIFKITRQTVHKHLSALVKKGYLTAEGHTRARVYRLGPVRQQEVTYEIAGAEEHLIHRRDFSFIFGGVPQNIEEICHYGFTEMVNNVIDHSEGEFLHVMVDRDFDHITIIVQDDGEGIFKRIARIMNLADPRESLLELSKGKLTTDPENHTGEGIFFASRAFDTYAIMSGDLHFSHLNAVPDDYLLHSDDHRSGTTVYMQIAMDSKRDMGDVYDEFSSGPDEYVFEKTVVPVRMVLYEGERLVSRSQAKRVLNRVDKFKRVILDFESVDHVGQAFADEVFRVYKARHPEINLTAINMSVDVEKMVKRALSTRI